MSLSDYDMDRALLALELRASALDTNHAGSLRDYVQKVNPGLLRFEHVPRLIDVGQRVADGVLKRVLVTLPPRYFKSEIWSRLFPGYFVRRFPDRYAAIVSYGAHLAWDLSSEARAYYREHGGLVSPDTSAKDRWDTMGKGGIWAAGTGGPMIGFGYHVGIVDDPLDPEKARSPTFQKRFEDWWRDKFLSRQEPDAAIVVVMQRLGPDDPIDFLYRREVGDDTEAAPEHWHVVCCEEIASDAELGRWDGPRGLPPTCTLEPDPRQPGEVLAPARFNAKQVAHLQRTAGTYTTAAQRQQRPAAPEGDFWREHWFGEYDELPPDAYNGGTDWDTAYTKDDANAASAWVRSFRGPGKPDEFPIYIEDCGWEWLEFPELVTAMRKKVGPHHIEAKATGKSAKQTLTREGVMVSEVQVYGDKFARASGAQPVVAQGRVFVKRSIKRKLLHGDRQGLLRVRAENLVEGKGDLDLNDTFVQTINRHVKRRLGPRYVAGPRVDRVA